MSRFERITIIHSTSTGRPGDIYRHRDGGTIPSTPHSPPSYPRPPAPPPPPSPPPPTVRRKYYVIAPEEPETVRQVESPKKHSVRFASGFHIPLTARKILPSEPKSPKRELVLVRRRYSTRRNQQLEPASPKQPATRSSPDAASQVKWQAEPATPKPAARQAPHHSQQRQSKEPNRRRSVRMPIRIHQDNEGTPPISPRHEDRQQPRAIPPELSYAEHGRLQRETERRQYAEIIAQETTEALARAQKELARGERERRQQAEQAAQARADDLARARREAQREKERHQNAERIALARAEEAARAEREKAQRERERCQRSEKAVRDTREDLTRVQQEADDIRHQRDQVIKRNNELELDRRQRIQEEKQRDLATRLQRENEQSKADDRVEIELERARGQAERYASETERLRRARRLEIPRLPRHPVRLHQMSGGPGSLEERGERFFNESVEAQRFRREDRNMPSSPRRNPSPRRDVGGGYGRRDERVHDDDFTRRVRRWG